MSKGSKRREYVLTVIFILFWSVTLIGVYYYASTLTEVDLNRPFYYVEIKGVNVVNLTRVVVEVQTEGNVDANVTGIFVEGVSVPSEPVTPFMLKPGSLQNFTLTLATPLKSTIGFPLQVRLTQGYTVLMQWYGAEATILGYGTAVGRPSFLVTISGPAEDMVVVVTDDEGRNFGNISVSKEDFTNGSATVGLEVPSNMMLLDELYYFTFFDMNGNQLYQTSCAYDVHV
jgi:hypothetical protein